MSRNAAKEAKLAATLEMKKRAAKKAMLQKQKAEKAVMQAKTKRAALTREAQVARQKSGLLKGDLSQTQRLPPPPKSAEEIERARDASKLQKEIGKKLAATKREIEAEAVAFERKQRAKAAAAERKKREEVRRRVEAEAAAEKEEAKRVRKQMEDLNKEKLSRKEKDAKRVAELAAKERATILAAKEKEEEHVRQALETWHKSKASQFESDLAARKRELAEAEAQRKRGLREAQREWREQEKVRQADEVRRMQRQREATSGFHEALVSRSHTCKLARALTHARTRARTRTALHCTTVYARTHAPPPACSSSGPHLTTNLLNILTCPFAAGEESGGRDSAHGTQARSRT